MSVLPPHLKRANFFKKLLEEEGISISQIAKKYNKSLSFVSNTLRLLKLPDIVKEGLLGGEISEGHARALMTLKDQQKIIILYKEIIVKKISVRQTESLARKKQPV